MNFKYFLIFTFALAQSAQAQLLKRIDVEKAGIDFRNTIKENGKYNHLVWDYVYNGGGVAIGDINNDGLPDIFFTGNQVSDRLYLNKGKDVNGNFQFQDITQNLLGNPPHTWSAGVTMADVNGDGWLDIYVCRYEPSQNKNERRNLLFINNSPQTASAGRPEGGLPSFVEKAEEYGIADTGFSVQASFFDMDNDGDLDLFVVNQPTSNNMDKMMDRLEPTSCSEFSNKLYRNDKNKYTDITKEAGLESCSYGLGVVVSDLNNDGWQDIYVSNDYFTSDFAYINQKNGNGSATRFKNQAKSLFKHESLYSMGVDIADFNNDGLVDVFTADMSAADHYRNKANMASMNTARFDVITKNFNHQYMFNALQLNRGTSIRGNGTFSEIAQLAGVANTDWSWSSLFIDIDNNGYKDLFVTNGIKRDIRFVDGMNKIRDMVASGQIKLSEIINAVPSEKLKNYAFKNGGNLQFSNATDEWGFDTPSFSNGMAYGDLDNDGDLDLVINNVDDLPFVYENTTKQNYLKVKLKGEGKNTFGYGAKVYSPLTPKGGTKTNTPSGGRGALVSELSVSRGFLSSSEPVLHFGLGDVTKIDSLIVIWNDKKRSILTNIKANQTITVDAKDSRFDNSNGAATRKFVKSNPIFKEQNLLDFKHIESEYNDFAKEVLLPNKLSQIGPALAVADADGDGLQDVFLGGAKGQKSQLFKQKTDGTFATEYFDDADQEKTSALFFDANADGKMDLYVASASNEFPENSPDLQDRLYINQNGKLVYDATALPEMRFSTGTIAANKNGKLFVGGLMQQQKYPYAAPKPPEGALIIATPLGRSDGSAGGAWRSSLFTDFDNDGDEDLITVGEWTKIQFLENINGNYTPKTIPSLEKTAGFWHSIAAADIDNDGDMDYLVGNLGLNNKFKRDAKKKFHVYSTDFDGNGVNDVVLAKGDDKNSGLLPVRGRECSSQQMPFIAKQIPTYDQFAKSSLSDIYTNEKLDKALHLEIDEMASLYIENLGNGNFQTKQLPIEAQFSVISDMIVEDFDKDGKKDVLVVGNKYEAEVETARYDASQGLLLKGDGKGNFRALTIQESGFSVNENSRKLSKIKVGNKNYILVAVNDGEVRAFEY